MRPALLAVLVLGCAAVRPVPPGSQATERTLAAAEIPPPPSVPGSQRDCPMLLAASAACSIGGTVATFLAGPAGVQSLRGTDTEPHALPVLQLAAGALAAGADACAVYAAARLVATCQAPAPEAK